jgi:hypothetical protein
MTKLQNNLSKLLAAAGSTTESKGEENAEAEEDAPMESTELPAEAGAEEEEEEVEDGDETMMTKFTGVPDAEGTRFMDDDDEEDPTELTVGNMKIKKERVADESLVESLLDDDDDTIS